MDRHQTTLRQIRVAITTSPAETAVSSPVCESPAPKVSNPTEEEPVPAGKRPERLANYQAVKALRSEGLSLRTIAKRLPINRQTVTRYAKADTFPERATRAAGPDPLQPYIPELLQRLSAGDVKTSELLQELRRRNYTGSDVRVYRWARANRLMLADSVSARLPVPADTPKTRPLSASRAAWLLVKSPTDLKADEEAMLTALQNLCPPAKLAHALVQEFRAMIRERQAERLTEWLERAVASGLSEIRNFAVGLKRDLDAVRAALSLPWSNGRTEGHVHRLKLLKRQMYGRASFALLRKRVLHAV
jgi:transposase